MPVITANRTLRTLQASASNAAGATATSTTWTAGSAISGAVQLRITNGATGPTVACSATINVSTDGTTWRAHMILTAGTGNAAVFDPGLVKLPDETMYAQVVFSGNTGQAVTVEAFVHELTSFTST